MWSIQPICLEITNEEIQLVLGIKWHSAIFLKFLNFFSFLSLLFFLFFVYIYFSIPSADHRPIGDSRQRSLAGGRNNEHVTTTDSHLWRRD